LTKILRPFRLCSGGCGRYGDFRGGFCDSCRHEKLVDKMQAAATAMATRRMDGRVRKGELLTARKVS
jgi:hypothetical protein